MARYNTDTCITLCLGQDYYQLLCPCCSRPPSLKDLEALEPDFYNSLLWICDNDPEPLDLTFTVEEVSMGWGSGFRKVGVAWVERNCKKLFHL